ncbi:MAG: hypothetical protein NXY57DRAFT_1087404 [Lentinula lateritia]|uniref:Uncharacterized protein n=1 Tax=Lentinula lateritia TaxID=40482 RepID=A0ABQ8VM30_9AGAR|nr:MAG: hypothetical protein NXY57DRAFT_1087404 [Lentinula lateritia]KAJ4497437.1 hypothetical protein C8R41DRAFT_917475 [Lentinula lateritia]
MLPLSVLTRTGVRGAAVFKYHFNLLCGLLIILLFTASTTAIPFAAVGQRDADNALFSGAQQLTVSKLLSPRDRESQTLKFILRFNGEPPSSNTRSQIAAQSLGTNLVQQLLTTASHVLDPTCRNTIFEVDKVIDNPTKLGDHKSFSVSFTKRGQCGPEYDLYQGWISLIDSPVTGEIETAGAKNLVAKIQKGKLVYPKVFRFIQVGYFG